MSARRDPVARAKAAWGEAMPIEIAALSAACARQTSRAVAQQIGYSEAVVSHALAAKYPGDLPKLFGKIRGALMGETVECPVFGDLSRAQCLDNQGKPFSAANPARARLYRACRRCPHRQQKDHVA